MLATPGCPRSEVIRIVHNNPPRKKPVVGDGDGIENTQDGQPCHHRFLIRDFFPVIHAYRVSETLWSYCEYLWIVG
jgi:hypothetical protein